jgi:RNA polymerase sigma factor (sigma-70 family)
VSAMTLHGVPSLISLSPRDEAARPHLWLVIERLRARDGRLIERVLRELLPPVRRWAFRLLGPHRDLEDAVQEALSEIASALHRFEGRSSLLTLAHTITLRTAYRFFRRPGELDGSVVELAGELESEADDPERRALAREMIVRLYACLERLPAQRRAAFVLCAIEGMSPNEAAPIAGCSALAMRSRLHHAKNDLDRAMGADEVLAPLVGVGRRAR